MVHHPHQQVVVVAALPAQHHQRAAAAAAAGPTSHAARPPKRVVVVEVEVVVVEPSPPHPLHHSIQEGEEEAAHRGHLQGMGLPHRAHHLQEVVAVATSPQQPASHPQQRPFLAGAPAMRRHTMVEVREKALEVGPAQVAHHPRVKVVVVVAVAERKSPHLPSSTPSLPSHRHLQRMEEAEVVVVVEAEAEAAMLSPQPQLLHQEAPVVVVVTGHQPQPDPPALAKVAPTSPRHPVAAEVLAKVLPAHHHHQRAVAAAVAAVAEAARSLASRHYHQRRVAAGVVGQQSSPLHPRCPVPLPPTSSHQRSSHATAHQKGLHLLTRALHRQVRALHRQARHPPGAALSRLQRSPARTLHHLHHQPRSSSHLHPRRAVEEEGEAARSPVSLPRLRRAAGVEEEVAAVEVVEEEALAISLPQLEAMHHQRQAHHQAQAMDRGQGQGPSQAAPYPSAPTPLPHTTPRPRAPLPHSCTCHQQSSHVTARQQQRRPPLAVLNHPQSSPARARQMASSHPQARSPQPLSSPVTPPQ